MEAFQEFAPLSWVLAGFSGLGTATVIYAVFSWAYSRWVRSRFNDKLFSKSGFVDPMAKTFENKRIFLNEFCLPSDPYINGKAFINCDIIGPVNLIFKDGNQLSEPQLPVCDAITISPTENVFNGLFIDNCTFKGCSFKRVTFLVPAHKKHDFEHLNWIHWLDADMAEPELPGLDVTQGAMIESQSPQGKPA